MKVAMRRGVLFAPILPNPKESSRSIFISRFHIENSIFQFIVGQKKLEFNVIPKSECHPRCLSSLMTHLFGFSGHREIDSIQPPQVKPKFTTEEDHVIVSCVAEYGANLRMVIAAGLLGGTWPQY
jgi:hypothetical protein